MKGQSYHRRKIRIEEAPQLGFGELKSRTINALEKLGGQRFSTEPGGYALENWVKGVKVLLDEFEEKAGAAKLSAEYLARRRDLEELVSRPVPLGPIDEEISKQETDISAIEGRIESERARVVSRISELRAEQARLSGELKLEQGRAADAAQAKDTGSFFRRLFGGKRAQARSDEDRTSELESRLAALPDEVREQQKQLKAIDLRSSESKLDEEWNLLESMQSRLKELEREKLGMVHLVKERLEVTNSMAEAISRMT